MRKEPAVLIFGGSGCLGEALAPKIHLQDHQIIVADLNPPAFAKDQDHITYEACDATDIEALRSLRAKLKASDVQVDHIVNTIGVLVETGLTDIFKTSAEEIEKNFDINLKAQIYPVRFISQLLTENKAPNKSITLTSSINASAGYSIPFYTAAKGGIESFIRPAAIELGRSNIRINAVSPGSVVTPDTANQPKNFSDRAAAAALGRLCTADDIADAMIASMFMLRGMTGQTMVIDAGQSINPAASLYRQRDQNVPPDNHDFTMPD